MNRTESPVPPGPLDDPRDLDLETRRALAREMAAAQSAWLTRLPDLVEPPAPAADFPAFLLETAPFAGLRAAIGDARRATDLRPGVREELQWFADRYRDYLRTTEGEVAFAPSR